MVTHPRPAWDQMTPEQKFAFLNEWAENLANANRSLQIDLHSLLGKVLKLEFEDLKFKTAIEPKLHSHRIKRRPFGASVGAYLPTRPDSPTAMRLKFVHLVSDVVCVVWLRNEEYTRREICLCPSYIARGYHDFDRRPPCANVMRERHSVHRPWHVDIGENQPDLIVKFEATNGVGGISRLVNDEA